jgi:hypothetical protein
MKQTLAALTPKGAGGLDTREPQDFFNANRAENLTVDQRTGAFSTRIGYEKYIPDPTDLFQPFQATTFIYSIHAAQDLARGARESVLFEEGGNLTLFYQSGQQRLLRVIAQNRHVPRPTESSSWYTNTPHGTLITNGHDWPLLVYPWPLGDAAESSGAIASVARDFGFQNQPPAPQPYTVTPLSSPTTSEEAVGTHFWYPRNPDSVDPVVTPGSRYGMGFSLGGSSLDTGCTVNIAVSFITDTGSEGPISDIGSVSWELPDTAAGYWYAFASSIPRGPEGTVARKIYRTKNLHEDSPDAGDDSLYFTTLIRNNFDLIHVESVRPVNLISPAPVIPTGVMPAPRARFSAYWEGRIWLDGGPDDSASLYYSEENLIEQFPVINAFSLTGEGGGITGMIAHAGALFIFRENSVDVGVRREDGGFSVVTAVPGIGCLAAHSIAAVPGLGLLFLARDGVYAIRGTITSSGSTIEAVFVSPTIREEIARITRGCESRAYACYWPQQREYQLWIPADGYDRPNYGLILHLDKTDRLGGSTWSTRPPNADTGLADWPVGSITVDASGTPIFGHNRGFEASVENAPVEAGLFVMSARRALGGSVEEDAFVYGGPPTSAYRTAWWDGGEAGTLKQVQYVTVHLLTTGDAEITVRHFRDGGFTAVEERTYKAQPPTTADLPVFDTAVMDGTALWSRERLVPLRVAVAPGKAFSFCWEFETTDDVIFIGWDLAFASDGTQVIAGKLA